jgi:hypothetical protein
MWEGCNLETEGPKEEETPKDSGEDGPMLPMQDKGITMPASHAAS